MTLLEEVKANIIIRYDTDDNLIQRCINSAVSYAESFQNKPAGFYTDSGIEVPKTTIQAIIMLASHFYESRDGSTGGFFSDNVGASQQVWRTVNALLQLNKDWMV
jgi:hypothetical protein